MGKLLGTLHHTVTDSLQLTAVQNAFEFLSHHVQSDFVVGNVSADIFDKP